MTPADLVAFLAYVRDAATAALARLSTVEPGALLADLPAEYDQQRQGWLDLLAMTEDDAVALRVAACEHAGRELAVGELLELMERQ